MSESPATHDQQAETPDPLKESKDALRAASDSIRISFSKLESDFPDDGFSNDKCTIEKCAHPGVGTRLKISMKEGGETFFYTLEGNCIRCGNGNDTEVHVFNSGTVTPSMINGRDIVEIDSNGNALTVEAGKRCEYNTQEHYRLKPEDFLAQKTIGLRNKIKAVLSWRPSIMGRMGGRGKKKESPKLPAPTGELIEREIVPQKEVDALLNEHADTMLQAAATMLGTDLDGIRKLVEEHKKQAADAATEKAAAEAAHKELAYPAYLAAEAIAKKFAAGTDEGEQTPKPSDKKLSAAKTAAAEAYMTSIKKSPDDTDVAEHAATEAYATSMAIAGEQIETPTEPPELVVPKPPET